MSVKPLPLGPLQLPFCIVTLAENSSPGNESCCRLTWPSWGQAEVQVLDDLMCVGEGGSVVGGHNLQVSRSNVMPTGNT